MNFAKGKPFAYSTAVDADSQKLILVAVVANEIGYYKLTGDGYRSPEEVQAEADRRNRDLGLSDEAVEKIIASSSYPRASFFTMN
jgi:hypothetical protein